MRIVHAISTLDPAAGGPPQVVARLAAAQASLGHDVAIVSDDRHEQLIAISQMTEKVPGYDQVKQVINVGQSEIRAMITHRDILHVHGVWDTMVRKATFYARGAGVPYVMMPHGMLDPWCLQQKKWKKRLALMLVYKRILNRAAFLHALNRDEAKLIEPLRLRCPVEVIPNGIFIEEIQPPPEEGRFRARYPQIGDRPFVLFLSRLHYKKGLDILAQAFGMVVQALPDAHLVVAGPDDGAKDAFEQQVAKLGIGERVHLVGPLYGSEKYEALRDADCFCLPSRQEGFSVAILEALACGTAVVITENCHFPEVAEAGAGLVVPFDNQILMESILKILSEPQLAQGMGDAGYRLVCETYTWGKIALKLNNFYKFYKKKGK